MDNRQRILRCAEIAPREEEKGEQGRKERGKVCGDIILAASASPSALTIFSCFS